MENCFIKNPIKVSIVNPLVEGKAKFRHHFLFVGDVPKYIKKILENFAGKPGKKTLSRSDESSLKDFYGVSWAKKLGLKTRTGGLDLKQKMEVAELDEGELELPPDIEEISSRGKQADLGPSVEDFKLSSFSLDNIDITEEDLALPPKETSDIRQVRGLVSIADVGDLDVEFEDDGEITYVFDVYIYPEDKLNEVKEKIYLATNIPYYRQHLYWLETNKPTTCYKLYAEMLYAINIEDLKEKSDQKMLGVNVDKFLYIVRDEIRVEDNERFQLVGNLRGWEFTFYLVDLRQFVYPVLSQLNDILNDSYRFDLFYYGFVVKYFPQMVREVFYDYVLSEDTVFQKYPDLARSKNFLKKLYQEEAKIANRNYRTVNKIMGLMESRHTSIAITNMIATTQPTKGISLNIRNLFDKIKVSKCYPQIHAYLEHEGKKYLFKKTHIKNQSEIPFPAVFRQGFIMAISLRKEDQENYHQRSSVTTIENEQSRYIFLNILPNGRYYIKSIWNEEEGRDFDELVSIMKKFVDPIIGIINSLSKFVFLSGTALPTLTKYNIVYHSLNISIFWKKLITEYIFKYVRTLWEPYINSGIISTRGIPQSNYYEFNFYKGIIDFDLEIIDRILSAANLESMRNHYSHLVNSALNQKWKQIYEGRIVKMIHRTTDIKFEVLNIKEQEFKIFHRYVISFISSALCDTRLQELSSQRLQEVRGKKVNKLKKLRENDPELYNLKKYGSKKVYSILCQNPRQPIIYTDEELDLMSEREKKNLVKFWNFTLNKPAYYGCPSKRYSHLSYIVGVHPKDYCLPCCGKGVAMEESKKKFINRICLDKYKFTPADFAERARGLPEGVSRHVMNYGKEIEVGRLTKLPNSALKHLLYNSIESNELDYYVVGVPQNFPSAPNAGVIYCISKALDMPVNEYLEDIIRKLQGNKKIFRTILNGSLLDVFLGVDDLVATIKDIFVQKSMVDISTRTKFNKWNELFIELSMVLLGAYVFLFIDTTGKGQTTNLHVSQTMMSELSAKDISETSTNRFILVIKRLYEYYPIMVIDKEDYFKNFNIHQRIFKRKDSVVNYLFEIISSTQKELSQINRAINLALIKEIAGSSPWKIIEKYINMRNQCYAVVLQKKGADHIIYFPVDYSSYISDGIPTNFGAFERTKHNIKLSEVMKFIEYVNKYIQKHYCYAECSPEDKSSQVNSFSLIEIKQYLKAKDIIGFTSKEDLPFYITEVDMELPGGVPTRDIHYDYEKVNGAILRREAPKEDSRHKLIGKALYNNYKYILLMLEFVNHMEKERNRPMRKKLEELIEKTNLQKNLYEFQKKFKELLKEYPDDINLLQSQLSDFYYTHMNKKIFLETIENTVYEFDRVSINKMRKLTKKELTQKLKELAPQFIVEQKLDVDEIKFPNIYLPCYYSKTTHADYCQKNKLIIDSGLDDMLEILASDILNPIKGKYLFSGILTDNIVSYFTFDAEPYEIITVIKL